MLLEPELEKHRIEITTDMQELAIRADRDLLKQLFINLVKNAQEAIQENGRISIVGRIGDTHYEFRVTDDGPGILEKDIDAIFDLHFTTKPKGNGVGLSVVQQIVEAHRGTIDVESTAGEGTTFFVRLPLDGAITKS
jgi:signal transduction histidine kinase